MQLPAFSYSLNKLFFFDYYVTYEHSFCTVISLHYFKTGHSFHENTKLFSEHIRYKKDSLSILDDELIESLHLVVDLVREDETGEADLGENLLFSI